MCRSTVQLSEEVKEAKKIADVTSGIEAMSNPNQEVSVSARRGATLSTPPSTGKVLIYTLLCTSVNLSQVLRVVVQQLLILR